MKRYYTGSLQQVLKKTIYLAGIKKPVPLHWLGHFMRRIFMNPVLTFVTYRRFLDTGVRGPRKFTLMSACGAYNLSAVRLMIFNHHAFPSFIRTTQITKNITRYIFSPIYNPLVNKQDYLDWTYMGVSVHWTKIETTT